MYAFYLEDGAFRVGTILADNTTSFQIEAAHGKRSKVKANDLLFQFKEPQLAGFMDAAQQNATDIDLDFLWEASGAEEFDYQTLARDYFGQTPSPIELAAVLIKLHGAPMHFYKKGKGRYKPAPEETLKAALASEEKKRKQAELLARHVAELCAGQLPPEFAPHLDQLLYAPEKNSPEWKAVDQAASVTGQSTLHLLEKCGAIPSIRDFHLNRFLREWFPQGPGFIDAPACSAPDDLPLAEVSAFSIDDETTTEIDDAFSLVKLDNGEMRLGIHIAAPALGIAPESALDAIAVKRLSTVYMPGDKITMLPASAVEVFTLKQGAACPAVSIYLTVAPDHSIRDIEHRVERVPIAANLRHEQLEPLFNDNTIGHGGDYAWREELEWLWHFANHLEEARGAADKGRNLIPEYGFKVEGEQVRIVHRVRGTPIDKVVAEMMILANSRWADWLAENKVAGLYRAQANGKTRTTTKPAPHQGLGVERYVWSTSPLRRYVDLVNQRQLVSLMRGEPPVYSEQDERLQTIMHAFEQAYDAYNDFQRGMERYWTLRYVQQENLAELTGAVIRENLVRIDKLPLVVKAAATPELAAGTAVKLTVRQIDLLTLEPHCVFAGTV